MGFIEDGERIIVMDINRFAYFGGEDYSLSADDMKRLRGVGVRTVLQQMWWSQIEKEPGKRDFTPVEVGLERAEQAGVKVLLGCYQIAPAGLNPDWYQVRPDGIVMQHFSFWNREADAYEEGFIRELASRYAGPGVLLQNTLISDGETMLHPSGSWHDPAGLDSFRQWYGTDAPTVRNAKRGWLQQSILDKFRQYQGLLMEVQAHNEIWTQLHPQTNAPEAQFMDTLLPELRKLWPDTAIFWLLYTFCEFPSTWRDRWAGWAKASGVNLVHGAMHVQGLPTSVPVAKGYGARLLCGPRHDTILPGVREISESMVKAIEKAIKELS